jgi:ABC-type nitrate/sulfonate/bicarbonate transport system substrate-binding protein
MAGHVRWLTAFVLLALVACAPAPSAPAKPAAGSVPAGPAAPASAPTPGAGAAAPSASRVEPTPAALRRIELAAGAVSATSGPLWVGVDHGHFARYGLEVEVSTLAAATATQAVQSGSVPFAATSASTVAAIAGGARDLVFIAGGITKPLFQVLAVPEVARVEDLRGRTVAGSTPGASASIALIETLRKHGLEPDRDAAMLYLREQPTILSGLVSGQVAAGVLASPFNKQGRDQGLRLLVDVGDSDIEIFGQSITTTRGLLERDYDTARRFVMGYVDAIEFSRRQPAATIDSLMRGTRSENRADAEEAYAVYRAVWDPMLSTKAMQTLLDHTDVPGARDLRPEQVFDDRIMRELEASGWLAQHLGPP